MVKRPVTMETERGRGNLVTTEIWLALGTTGYHGDQVLGATERQELKSN